MALAAVFKLMDSIHDCAPVKIWTTQCFKTGGGPEALFAKVIFSGFRFKGNTAFQTEWGSDLLETVQTIFAKINTRIFLVIKKPITGFAPGRIYNIHKAGKKAFNRIFRERGKIII